MTIGVSITADNIRAIASGARADIAAGIVEHQRLLPEYGIDTQIRVAHFLAQCAVETAGFTRLVENLYYTSTKRLMQVWPSRFKTAATAAPYVRNPEKLANNVYANRLGNTAPGDGFKYIGRGLKQTTGKTNYSLVEKDTELPVVAQPELLEQIEPAIRAACVYWRDNRLNRFADAGDVVGLTRAIQGGKGGLADRRVYTERALRVRWQMSGAGSSAGADEERPEPAAQMYPVLRMGAGRADLAQRPIVREAQMLLEAHGFEPGKIDGVFGGGTDNAVRAFQEAASLLPDGVIGKKTWALLLQDPAPVDVVEDAPAPAAPVDKPTIVGPRPPGEEGMAGPMPPLNVEEERAARVQLLLTEKGYYDVGEVDGDPAGKTQGAILAFRNENGLPLTPDIDDELLAALEAAPKRYIPPERAEATEAEIMKKDTPVAEPIRQAWWQKTIAQVVGWLGGGGTIIYNSLGDAVDFLTPVKSFLGSVNPLVWGAVIVAACFVVWFGAKRAGDKTAAAYREGKVT